MKRLVVIGAGVSGLAAARVAAQLGSELPGGLHVLVLERDGRVGGKVATTRRDGWCIERGPTGYMDAEPEMRDLVASSGLTPVRADDAAARRFIVRRGRPVEVRPAPLSFARSGILSPLGLLRLATEPFRPRRRGEDDESVWDFAARRIGAQAADRLIAPMMLGVFAGDARRLSLPAAFPRLAEIEREHGSLIRGMLARRRQRRGGGPSGPAGQLTSFAGGLDLLPRALADSPGVEVRLNAAVAAIRPGAAGGWSVAVEGDSEVVPADAVLLAGEAWAMAPLLKTIAPPAHRSLSEISCPPVVVTGLGYGPEALAAIPRGFGVLIPRGEGYRILGCLWDTHLFPEREPSGHLLLRAMSGGSVDPSVIDLDDDEIVASVREDLRGLFGLTAEPTMVEVARWNRAIPQYELGHLDRVRVIEDALARSPGLFMAGNVLHGVSLGKVAALGLKRGRECIDYLFGRSEPGSDHRHSPPTE